MIKEEALLKRLESFIKIYNKGEYPVRFLILGFGPVGVFSREEFEGRIKELAELTKKNYSSSVATIKKNNQEIKQYIIKII